MPTAKLICPTCGVEMNHHADKLDLSAPPRESETDLGLDGAIEETHTCPGCGNAASRRAD
jgi:ribosomal protein S27AE